MKVSVVIGRFQIPHIGHLALFKAALEKSDRLIILVGSVKDTGGMRNPFTFGQRCTMLYGTLAMESCKDILILPLEDDLYQEDNWIHSIVSTVRKNCQDGDMVTFFGHKKDKTSEYLDLVSRHFATHLVDSLEDGVSSTDLRKIWMSGSVSTSRFFMDSVRPFVRNYISGSLPVSCFPEAISEEEYLEAEQATFSNYPYPESLRFSTVDAMLYRGDEVLLIKRKGANGDGRWAMVGGFVDSNEDLYTAVQREIAEEIGLGVDSYYQSSTVGMEVFSDPSRSVGIGRITHVFPLKMSWDAMDKIVANPDEVGEVKLVSLDEMRSLNMFSDHRHIINKMMADIKKATGEF